MRLKRSGLHTWNGGKICVDCCCPINVAVQFNAHNCPITDRVVAHLAWRIYTEHQRNPAATDQFIQAEYDQEVMNYFGE